MILGNKFLQVFGANKLSLFSEGIFEIEVVNSELIRHHYIGIVRHSSGNKMMTAYGLQPPDFIFIRKGNPVHFIGAVFFQKFSKAKNAFSCGVDIGKHQADHILFSDSADLLRLSVFRLLIDYKRVSGKYALIAGNGLGSGHGNIFTVYPCCTPDSLILINRIGHTGITKRILGKRNPYMRKHGNIFFSLILRFNHNEFFSTENAGSGILISCNHR